MCRAAERESARARAAARARARRPRGRGARAACSSSSTVLTRSKNPSEESTELHDCTIRESARALASPHSTHRVSRGTPLTRHGPHTDSHSELSLSSLSPHTARCTASAQTAAGRRPRTTRGARCRVPHANRKNASWIAATEHRGAEIGDDARERGSAPRGSVAGCSFLLPAPFTPRVRLVRPQTKELRPWPEPLEPGENEALEALRAPL